MFKNESKPIERKPENTHSYGFDRPSKYLFHWSRLFQAIVSIAGTYHLTKKWHNQQTGIYKTEGGCNIPGVGELVLNERSCRFDVNWDRQKTLEPKRQQLSDLITYIVLNWNPEDPIDSMILAASQFICEAPDVLASQLNKNKVGPFDGNALSSFFDWNPFVEPPIDRPYQKFCLMKFYKWPEEKVNQMWADEDLGKALLDLMQEKCRKLAKGGYISMPMCCDPNRRKDGSLYFWVNTGRQTQIDGWKTQEELESWINSDETLVDIAKS